LFSFLALANDTKNHIISNVEAFLVGSSTLEKEISYINNRIFCSHQIMAWNHEHRTKNEERNEMFRAHVTAQLHWEQSRRLTLLCWREELQQLPF
jgi:hypothetical protein